MLHKNIWCVARHIKKIDKRGIEGLYWIKILIVLDVSATTVAFFSKDKKCKCLTASCEVISRKKKVIRSFSVKVALKPIRTISNILRIPKDKIGTEDKRGILYKTRCKSCDSVYVGRTSRALKTRVKQHARAIATMDENSLLAEQDVLYNHEIGF